jgi:streptogramin lyase
MVALPVIIAMACAPAVARADPSLTEFGQPTGYDASQPIAGPDGDVWFVNEGAGVASVSPAGTFAELNFGTPMVSTFIDIAAGAGDSIWVSDYGLHAIWRVLPDAPAGQQATEFTANLPPGASPQLLTLGPDGNIWFVDAVNHEIGRITPAGVITMFPGTLNNMSELNAMTVGPDGNLWFTDPDNSDVPAVGSVTMSGQITEIPVTGMPDDITAGPDGNVWFTDSDGLGKVNPATDVVTRYTAGLQTGAVADAIIAGPDGNVWFDDQYATNYEVGRITPAGTITEYPLGDGLPVDLTVGLDGNIWVAQSAGTDPATRPQAVDRVIPAPTVTTADIQRFSAGLQPAGIQDGDDIITGPDGNLWFTASAAPKGIGKLSLQIPPTATTGAASAITSSTAAIAGTVDPLGSATTVTVQYGTSATLGSTSTPVALAASGTASPVSASLTGLPAGTTIYYRVVATSIGGTATGATETFTTSHLPTRTIVRHFGNQRVTLTTPARSMCQARTGRYSVSLSARKLKSGRRLKFMSASFYLDKGVRHSHREKRKVKVNGKTRTKTVTVVTFSANATARRLPVKRMLALRRLARGTHTLAVRLAYDETRTATVERHHKRHRVKRIVTVTRTLKAKLSIC